MENPGTRFERWISTQDTTAHATETPPLHTLCSDKWPARPEIFDQINLGAFVSETDAKLAHQTWSLPDEVLGNVWRHWRDRPYPDGNNDPVKDVLARNVYEVIMCNPLVPVERAVAEAMFRDMGLRETWDGPAFIAPFKEDIIDGSSVRGLSSWRRKAIEKHLVQRGISTEDLSREEMEEALIEDELETHCGVMPRSDLSHWGIERKDKYALQPFHKTAMTPIDMYTFAIHLSPYNPTYWVSRAFCHYQQAFFDLAIGDAYRAMILCDVLTKQQERMRMSGLYSRVRHAIEQHILAQPREDKNPKDHDHYLRNPNGLGVNQFIPTLQKSLQQIISLSLMALGAWNDNRNLKNLFSTDLSLVYRDARVPELRTEVAQSVEPLYFKQKDSQKLYNYEYYQGADLADKKYPYEASDVQRDDKRFLDALNRNIFQQGGGNSVPTPHVSAANASAPPGSGLGVYATKKIKEGVVIHGEEPVIRGHLPIHRVRDDPQKTRTENRCLNCMRTVTEAERAKYLEALRLAHFKESHTCDCFREISSAPIVDVPSFCFPGTGAVESKNAPKSCLGIARKLFHFESCGKSWGWLYDSMQCRIHEGHKSEHMGHNECQGTALSLILRNVFEITLHRRGESPSLAPHEINELLVLEEPSLWRGQQFPFSMVGNIIVPFDILMHMGVDIFRDFAFDTWVIQIVLRKLLTNVIPWALNRQGNTPDFLAHDMYKPIPTWDGNEEPATEFWSGHRDLDPSFPNLYLFPGFSLFNHACRKSHNAEWAYDQLVPNRVVVWATKDIKKEEEIRIRYRYGKFRSQGRASRVLGKPCGCDMCKKSKPGIISPPPELEPSDGDSDATNGTWKIERKKRPNMEEETKAQAKFRASNEKTIKDWRGSQMPEIIQPQDTSKVEPAKKRKGPEDTENQQPGKKRARVPGQDTDEEVMAGSSTGDNVPNHARIRRKRLEDRSLNRKKVGYSKFAQHLKEEVEGSGKSKRKVVEKRKEKYRDAQREKLAEGPGL